jgi:hypothetical protein
VKENPARLCDLCSALCGGFAIQFNAEPQYPEYFSCSDGCDDVLLDLVIQGRGGVVSSSLTDMEATAFTETRQSLWEAIKAAIGEARATEVFGDLSGERVDYIIHKVVRGYQFSMRTQSARGAIPAPLGDGRTDDPDDWIPF